MSNFSTTMLVKQSPAQVFAAINNVGGWWEEIDGNANQVGAVFTHRYEDVHRCELEVIDRLPNRRIAWRVRDNYFAFVGDTSEWKDTMIVFAIARKGDHTEIRLTHEGLTPNYECFDVCSNAWVSLMNDNLRGLIARSAVH